MDSDSRTGLEIAVIGMACRFPGASSVEQLWDKLSSATECIRRISAEEAQAAGIAPEIARRPDYVLAAASLDKVDLFDAALFGLTPREAELMDPQQRLFLEIAWEALERAGYDPARTPGPIGIFGGVGMPWYLLREIMPRGPLPEDLDAYQIMFGNNKDHLTMRAAYKLGLRGPSVTVQTACSSSLVAVHLACRALLAGECDVALAGGVSVILPQGAGYRYIEGGVMSPDGHCRAFDAAARGTVFGSGAGIVALKRLEDALADGDSIAAVIKGSAVNNDGANKVGYAAPSLDAQTAVIRAAHLVAEVDAETIGYIEAHGTGTPLGDPIEIAALTSAFRESTSQSGYCAIGSVKTNLGHLDTAAGIAGFIKAVLAVEHGMIPASLHFRTPNPRIDFAGSPFFVAAEGRPWPREQGPRRAGVNSFGMGGTNAHVVLEEAPAPQHEPAKARPVEVITLSAATSSALRAVAANVAEHLRATSPSEPEFADMAHTLRVGRRALPHRALLISHSASEAAEALAAFEPARVVSEKVDKAPPVVFMYPGQGSQHPGMARDLYDADPRFRDGVDRCAALFERHLKADLRPVMFESVAEGARPRLMETMFAQPALFTVSFALAELWRAWGVRPSAMVGHSIGEYVAAAVAGVLALEDAVALVAERARLMQAQPPGAMLAVELSLADIEASLPPQLSLAAVNGPTSCVVGGALEAIARYEDTLRARDVVVSRLRTSHAFHSPLMDGATRPLREFAAKLQTKEPEIPYASNLTGTWIESAQLADPGYWARQLREPVRFQDGLMAILEREPTAVLLEVGPGRALGSILRKLPAAARSRVLASLRHANESRADQGVMLETAGRLWLAGVDIDWSAVSAHQRRRRVVMPTYPFERQRFWIRPDGAKNESQRQRPEDDRRSLEKWLYTPVWRQAIGAPTRGRESAPPAPRWLVLDDGSPLAGAVIGRLQEQGNEVFTSARTNAARWADAPPSVALRALLFCGPATDDPERPLLQTTILEAAAVVRSLEQHPNRGPVRIGIVSSGMHDVSGDEPLSPEAAGILGLAASLPQECSARSCSSFDVPSLETNSKLRDAIASDIVRHMTANESPEVLAFRGSRWWTWSHELLEIHDEGEPLRPVRDAGVYLIVGGLGGVGQEIGRWLAARHGARLILTTRGDRDQHAHLTELVSLGSEVEVVPADVRDPRSMKTAVEHAIRRFGRIDGVIYAAGVKSRHLLRDLSNDDVHDHVTVRLNALRALAKALDGVSIDFCAVVSSLAAFLGGPGLAPYAAGHAAANALVAAEARAGKPWLAINCDNWITRADEDLAAAAKHLGLHALDDAMPAAEGAEAFFRAVRFAPSPSILLSRANLAERLLRARTTDTQAAAVITAPARERHPRPALEVPYAPPRTPLEESMVDIWGEVLGIQSVGVDDNFFELGGDSVMGILFLQKLQQRGHKLSARDLFEQPTIRQLAGLSRAAETRPTIFEPHVGPTPLLPSQERYLERAELDAHRYCHELVLEWQEPLHAEALRSALDAVVAQHDALRCRFTRAEGGWTAEALAPGNGSALFASHDLAGEPDAGLATAIDVHLREVESGFDITRGPLVACVVFWLGAARRPRIALLIHHLLVDAISWQIIASDLLTAYAQVRAGAHIRLPPPTTPLKAAVESITRSIEANLHEESAYWQSQLPTRQAELPTDFPRDLGRNLGRAVQSLRVGLDADTSARLLRDAPRRSSADLRGILLGALALVVRRWTARDEVVIDVEALGRDTGDGVDLSRTVGWFTATHPLRLVLGPEDRLGELAPVVSANLRRVPHGGTGFGVLRQDLGADVAGAIRAAPEPEIGFLYLGGSEEVAAGVSIPVRRLSARLTMGDDQRRRWLIEVSSFVEEGEIVLEWRYCEQIHRRESILALAMEMTEHLRSIASAVMKGAEPPIDVLSEAAEFGISASDLRAAVAAAVGGE